MNQRTLKRQYQFEGKGLHSGRFAHLTICPAPAGAGIRFQRTDLGTDAFVDALAENVSSTSRSTTLSRGRVSVGTVEHLLSALTGLGVDNALVMTDSSEVPILDGSALPYVEAIGADGLLEQDAPRQYVEFKEELRVEDKSSGAYIRVIPADEPSFEVTIDFNSGVLGVQTVAFDFSKDYATEIAPCRTFCFFREISTLLSFGLVKGGTLDNAIVIVDAPVSRRKLDRMARMFNQPSVSVSPDGYLSNVDLRFPDECGRHKLLDLMGDMRLAGGFPKARIIAYKPGHKLNTSAAKKIRQTI